MMMKLSNASKTGRRSQNLIRMSNLVIVAMLFLNLVMLSDAGAAAGIGGNVRPAIFSFTAGFVQHSLSGDDWLDAYPGMRIQPGSILKSGKGGVVEIAFAGGTIIRMPENTEIQVPDITENTLNKLGIIQLVSGMIWVRLSDDSPPEIRTVNSAVKGGSATYTLQVAGDTARLSVLGGFVDFIAMRQDEVFQTIRVAEHERSFARSGHQGNTEPQFFNIRIEQEAWLHVHRAVELGITDDDSEASKADDVSEVPEVDDIPEVREVDDVPEMPEVDDIPKTPETAAVEDSPDEPDVTQDLPDIASGLPDIAPDLLDIAPDLLDISPVSVPSSPEKHPAVFIITPVGTALERNVEFRGLVNDVGQLKQVKVTQNHRRPSRRVFNAEISGHIFSYPVSLMPGRNTFLVEAFDSEGNTVTLEHTVFLYDF